jgi:2-dehydropantoate 2-reductase
MKICVYGAGAIGGHLAARLALGGAEVSIVARGRTSLRSRRTA